MNKFLFLSITILLNSSFLNAQKKNNTNPSTDRKKCLVFDDQFDTFNLKNWKHDITMSGGGNWEFQWYTNNRTNSFVENGVLYLKPTFTADFMGEEAMKNGGELNLWNGEPGTTCTDNSNYGCERTSGQASGGNYINPIQSARIKTLESVALRYGRVEVRAKLPRGDWLWPAIWMMPKYASYGTWPASGEIDIMESRGNIDDYPYGNASTVSTTLHWGPNYFLNRYNLTHASVKSKKGTFADDFHTYALEWNEKGLTTTVDNTTILSVPFDQSFWQKGKYTNATSNPWAAGTPAAPFDQEFYLIINLAVGGLNNYWPDHPIKPWTLKDEHPANKFWDAKDKWLPTWGKGNDRALAIDYVKMWSYDC
ncbi:unnamed protein product [Cunninghamella echinulata]